MAKNVEIAIVAGGCFWGVEYHFRKKFKTALIDASVGYIGGHIENPTYRIVTGEKSGHYEALKIVYDSDRVDYETILKYFFSIHDPTQADGQGVDVGPQYRSAIFPLSLEQEAIAKRVIGEVELSTGLQGRFTTKIISGKPNFFQAEGYHQNYLNKLPQNRASCHSERYHVEWSDPSAS
eukprot:Trichotokara_eunicae@DN5078_c0_g1_i2.p1